MSIWYREGRLLKLKALKLCCILNIGTRIIIQTAKVHADLLII